MYETESILARGTATAEVVEIAPSLGHHAERVPLDLSLVDAVLVACEFSDDQNEVRDLVDAMVHRPDVPVVCEPPASPAWATPPDRIRHTSDTRA